TPSSSADSPDSFAGYDFKATGAGSGIKDPFLIKLDPDGDLIWGTNADLYSPFNGQSIAIDGDNVYLGLGILQNTWGGIAAPGPVADGLVPDIAIMRFDAQTGEAQELIRDQHAPSQDAIMALALDHNGDLVAGGYFGSSLFYGSDLYILDLNADSDFFAAKYSPRETPCIPPKTVHVRRTGDTSVKIYWSPRQGETQWEVAYSNVPEYYPARPDPNINPDTEGTHVTVQGDPELVLDNVSTTDHGKHYQVFVRPICGEAPGTWSAPVYFVLEDLSAEDCLAPRFVQSGQITKNSAEISWTPVGTETQWKVSYGTTYQGAQESAQSALMGGSPQTTLEGLAPDTEYVVFVEAVCSADDHSEKEGPLSFRTDKDMAVKDRPLKSLKVYPNPTTGVLNVQGKINLESYKLFDLQGRLVKHGEPEGNQIDLSGIGTGLDLLRIRDQKGETETMKVVKQ